MKEDTDIVDYDVLLQIEGQEDGKIDLDRLAFLSRSISKIARGALQIRLSGISSKLGKPSDLINKALKIKLKGLQKGSTILQLETKKFGDTIGGFKLDAFRSSAYSNYFSCD